MAPDEDVSGNNEPRRTSAVAWIVLAVIVILMVSDVLAVLLPAFEAATSK